MKSRNALILTFALMAILFFAPGTAKASYMSCAAGSYNAGLDSCEVSYWVTFVDITGNVNKQLPKFDTNWGTLLQVVFGVNSTQQNLVTSLAERGENYNTDGSRLVPTSPGTATLTLDVLDPNNATVLDFTSSTLTLPTTEVGAATGAGCPSGNPCTPGNALIATGSGTGWNPTSASETLTGSFGNFQAAGGGNFTAKLYLGAEENRTVSANTATIPFPKASGTLTVQYLYTGPSTDTPEPFTFGLLGSGLVGLGILGRKRFSR